MRLLDHCSALVSKWRSPVLTVSGLWNTAPLLSPTWLADLQLECWQKQLTCNQQSSCQPLYPAISLSRLPGHLFPPRPAPAPRQPSPICCKHISWKSGLDLNYVYESVRQKFRPGGIWFQMFWHVLPFKHKPQLQEGISPLRGMECYGRWCGQANLNLNLSPLHCQPLIFLHGWWGGWGGMENGRPWRVSVGSRVIVRKHDEI